MSLCEAGLSEAHNLSKCGKIFMEIAKCTFLTSEESPAPNADQKRSLSSKLGRDYEFLLVSLSEIFFFFSLSMRIKSP